MTTEARIQRELDRLENPSLDDKEIARIERKLEILRKQQRDEQS